MDESRLQQLTRDVQVLQDIEAIKRLKHAYFRCIDTANLDELTDLLHPAVHAKLVGGHYDIEFDTREDYLEMLANSFNSQMVGQHLGHHPEIEIESEVEATGKWYLFDTVYELRGGSFTQGSAIYTDKYLKTDGHWQILDTSYFRIYEISEAMPEPPRLSAHYLAEHGRTEPTFKVADVYARSKEL